MLLSPTAPSLSSFLSSFFFNDTAPTEIYTLSLHDALPIFQRSTPSFVSMALTVARGRLRCPVRGRFDASRTRGATDRKSTRLNSSHPSISYAVFCLKKKKKSETKYKRK